MRKDKEIERAFSEYFEGSEAPSGDLERAKRVVLQSPQRRGIVWKIASAFVCVLIVCAAFVGILADRDQIPNDSSQAEEPSTEYYALSDAQEKSVTYTQLVQSYGAEVSGLAPFSWSENGHAQYSLYVREGEEVLIRVQLRYLRGLLFWEGELYIDLTDGKSKPEQLRSFDGLDEGGKLTGKVYRYTTRYENGEYVSDAKISLPAADYYMTVMGQNKDSVFFLLGLLAKNS